jgi:hypothetical protein
MPLFPGRADYPHWAAELRGLGARHTAEALAPDTAGPGFKVLDGVWFRSRGMRWQRLDRPYVAAWRRGRGQAAGAFADRVDAALAADPMAVRRIALYELAVLLQAYAPGERAAAAQELGVDAAEAAALAGSVTAALPPQGLDQDAAENIQAAWERGRLTLAGDLADRLSGATADPSLRRLLADVAAARGATDALLAEGHRLLAAGRHAPAARRYLRAALLVGDDPRPITGLLRTARNTGTLRLVQDGDGVRLEWPDTDDCSEDTVPWDGIGRGEDDPGPARTPPVPGVRRFHVVRYAEGRPEQRIRIGVAPDGRGLRDPDPPPGARVCYAALPVRAGRVAGPPLTGGPWLIAPETAALSLTVDRTTVTATWRLPRDAVTVRVTRLAEPPATQAAPEAPAAARTPVDVPCDADGFADAGLGPGCYTYHLSCVYRAPDDALVTSPGLRQTVTVEEWPVPVTALTGRADGEKAEIGWDTPARGTVRLLLRPLSQPPLTSGDDACALLPELSAALSADGRTARLTVPPGPPVRVTAVTVLGRRAVAGPSLVVHTPPPVGALSAQRPAPGRLQVSFDWPDGVGTVVVRLDQEHRIVERRLTRSSYLRDGLHLTAADTSCTVSVRTPPDDAAQVVLGACPQVTLPPQYRVTYHLLRPGLRVGARRTLEVRAVPPTPQAPANGDAGEPVGCPDFLLAGRAELPPLRPDQGREEIRLAGALLASGEPVRMRLDLSDRPRPYRLRGFLLGRHAPAARLDHPAPDSLVVR